MRHFLCLASTGLLVFLSSCTNNPSHSSPTTLESRSFPERIIDAHVHLDDLENGDLSPLKEFTDNHVAAVVAHSGKKEPTPQSFVKSLPLNATLCAAVIQESTVNQIEQALKDSTVRCLKVYLGYVPMYAADPFYLPFYRLAEKYDVPVVFHAGDTSDKMASIKYADPLTVDEVAIRFPGVKFVLAHMGNPWFQSTAEVVYKNDNVYADTSAIMIGDVSTRDPEMVRELLIKPLRWSYYYVENPKKFLFGTDWPLTSVKGYIEVIKQSFPEDCWQDVFYRNAVELFKIELK